MFKRIKELNKTSKVALLVITLLLLVLTVLLSYSFLAPVVGPGSKTQIDLNGLGQETLTFENGPELSLNITPENFGMGATNLSSTSHLLTHARANKSNEVYNATYNVFINIGLNNYEYSDGSTPEILLKVTDPNGAEVETITGLTRTTQKGVTGFDITTKTGVIEVARDYDISSPDYNTITTQEWNFEIIVIAHDFDQSPNQGKDLIANIEATKNEATEFKDLKVNLTYNNQEGFAPTGVKYTTMYSDPAANVYWDQKYQKLVIRNHTPLAEYDLEFSDYTGTNLNDHIISLSGTTQGDGMLVNENGYRYQGKDPNNYIWFNNELWRVIGVFDNTSHGIEEENLVKIIREKPIGGLAWDAGDVNDWNASSLKELLNNEYLNALDASSSSNCSVTPSVLANCNYDDKGIKTSYRSLIEEVTWYLGGLSTESSTTDMVYNAERGTVVYSGRPLNGIGKIGLMYMSDYGYSVLSSSCSRTTNLSSYYTSRCAGSSWLYGNSYGWSITPYSSKATSAWPAYRSGGTRINSTSSGNSVRPVLYLKSSVKILGGSGSNVDPFIVK